MIHSDFEQGFSDFWEREVHSDTQTGTINLPFDNASEEDEFFTLFLAEATHDFVQVVETAAHSSRVIVRIKDRAPPPGAITDLRAERLPNGDALLLWTEPPRFVSNSIYQVIWAANDTWVNIADLGWVINASEGRTTAIIPYSDLASDLNRFSDVRIRAVADGGALSLASNPISSIPRRIAFSHSLSSPLDIMGATEVVSVSETVGVLEYSISAYVEENERPADSFDLSLNMQECSLSLCSAYRQATATSDYVLSPLSLEFQPQDFISSEYSPYFEKQVRVAKKRVRLRIVDDDLDEYEEVFLISITNPQRRIFSIGEGNSPTDRILIKILDDERTALVDAAIMDVAPEEIVEDDTQISVGIRLTTRENSAPTENYNLNLRVIGSNDPDTDFDPASATITFSPDDFTRAGDRWQAESARVIRIIDDQISETDERFHILLEATDDERATVLPEASSKTIVILDDDVSPTLMPTLEYDELGNLYITLDWDYPYEAYDYELERTLTLPNGTIIDERNLVLEKKSYSAVYSSDSFGRILKIRVRARTVNRGRSPFSDILEITLPLNPPRNLTALAGRESVRLNWELPSNSDGVAQYQYQQDDGRWLDVPNSDETTTRWTIFGLENRTFYSFKLRSVGDLAGTESPAVAIGIKTTGRLARQLGVKPFKIEDLFGEIVGSESVRLSWSARPGTNDLTEYEYRRKLTGRGYGDWLPLEPIFAEGAFRFTLDDLDNNNGYVFQVRAKNGDLVGPISNEATNPVPIRVTANIPRGRIQNIGETERTFLYAIILRTEYKRRPQASFSFQILTRNEAGELLQSLDGVDEAEEGQDYSFIPQTITINPDDFENQNGFYQLVIPIDGPAIIDDEMDENDEYFYLGIEPTAATPRALTGLPYGVGIKILDDDPPTSVYGRIVEETARFFEGGGAMNAFTLMVMTRENVKPISSGYGFIYHIENGAGDFVSPTGGITIEPSDFEPSDGVFQAEKAVALDLIDDSIFEPEKTYKLILAVHPDSIGTAFTDEGVDNDSLVISLIDDDYPVPTDLSYSMGDYDSDGLAVQFSWNYAFAAIEGFEFQQTTSAEFNNGVSTTEQSYNHVFGEELGSDTLRVRVRAEIVPGFYSAWSDELADISLPFSAPRDFEAVVRGQDLRLNWDHPSPESDYRRDDYGYRYQYQRDGGNWVDIPGADTTNHVAVSGLEDGTIYTFRLRATSDAAGVAGMPTAGIALSTEAAPGARIQKPGIIKDLKAGILTAKTAILSWTPPSKTTAATQYQYRQRRENEEYGDWTDIEARSSRARKSYIVPGLDNDRTYYFQVRAENSPLFADPSNEAETLVQLVVTVRDAGDTILPSGEIVELDEGSGNYRLKLSLTTSYSRAPTTFISGLKMAVGDNLKERFLLDNANEAEENSDYSFAPYMMRIALNAFIKSDETDLYSYSFIVDRLMIDGDLMVEGDEYFYLTIDNDTAPEFSNLPYDIGFKIRDASAVPMNLNYTFEGFEVNGDFSIRYDWSYDDPRDEPPPSRFVLMETIDNERTDNDIETESSYITLSYNASILGRNLTYQVSLAGAEDFSNSVSILVPSKPASFTAMGGDRNVSLFWTAPIITSGIAGYQYKQNDEAWIDLPDSDTYSHIITGLDPATTYTYRLRAIGSLDLTSQETHNVTISTETMADASLLKPARIDDLNGELDGGTLRLSWTEPDNVNSSTIYEYRRRKGIENYGEWVGVDSPTILPSGRYSHDVEVPQDASDYFFIVRARTRNATLVGDPSNEITSSVRLKLKLMDALSGQVFEGRESHIYIINVTTDRPYEPRRDYRLRVYDGGTQPLPFQSNVLQATADDYGVTPAIYTIKEGDFELNSEGNYSAILEIPLTIKDDNELEEDEYFYFVIDRAPLAPLVIDELPYIAGVTIIDDDRKPENLRVTERIYYSDSLNATHLNLSYEWDYPSRVKAFHFEQTFIEEPFSDAQQLTNTTYKASYKQSSIGRILKVRVRAEIAAGVFSDYSDYLEVPLPQEGFRYVKPQNITDLESETLRNGDIRFTWTLPNNTYSDTIFQYRRRIGEGDYGNWIDIEPTIDVERRIGSYLVTGIDSNNDYLFQIRALNGDPLNSHQGGEPSKEVDNPVRVELSFIDETAELIRLSEDYGDNYRHYILFNTLHNRKPNRTYTLNLFTLTARHLHAESAIDFLPIHDQKIEVKPDDFVLRSDGTGSYIAVKNITINIMEDEHEEPNEYFHLSILDTSSTPLYFAPTIHPDILFLSDRLVRVLFEIVDNDKKPELTQLRNISITDDATPYFFFNSSEVGQIEFSGACKANRTLAYPGQVIIPELLKARYEPLEDGRYECGLRVSVSEGLSNKMDIPPFIVDGSYESNQTDPLLYGDSLSYDIADVTSGNNVWLTPSDGMNFKQVESDDRSRIVIEVNDLDANRSYEGAVYGELELAAAPLTRKENGNYILNIMYKLLRLER